ncbi:MAG: PAS domain S-box protein [Thermoleophilia bacterium]
MTTAHRLALAAAATLVAGGLALALTAAGDRGATAEDEARVVFSLAIGWSFALCGLLAWARRPESRFGALMVAVGLTWFVGSLARWQEPVPTTIAVAVQVLPLAILAHLLLAFPSGRLGERGTRVVALAGYVAAVPGQLAWMLFLPFDEPPRNAARAFSSTATGEALEALQRAAGVAIIAAIVWLVAVRWRVAGAAGRRALAPVLSSGAAVFVALAVDIVGLQFSEMVQHVGEWLLLVALVGVPLAFVAGLLEARLAHSGAVARLVADLRAASGPGVVRDALARALGDPSLELAFPVATGGHVDADGRPVELPAPGPGARRVATPVVHDGVPVATLVHDAVLRERAGLLQTVAGTASFALENARLTADVRARVEELRASEERLRALIDAAPAAIVELDADGCVMLWNGGAERIYGWRAEEVLGGPVPSIPDELRDEIAATYARVVAGETALLRTRRVRRDGRWIDVEIAAAPIRDASGAVVRQIGIATDDTARRAAGRRCAVSGTSATPSSTRLPPS